MMLRNSANEVAFGSDVHCVSDVTPYGVVGKHYITIKHKGSNPCHNYGKYLFYHPFTKIRKPRLSDFSFVPQAQHRLRGTRNII